MRSLPHYKGEGGCGDGGINRGKSLSTCVEWNNIGHLWRAWGDSRIK